MEGTLEVTIGESTYEVSTGSFVLIPRGADHSFTKVGIPAKIMALAQKIQPGNRRATAGVERLVNRWHKE